MLFAKRKDLHGSLKPFVLKIRDGFLVGLAPDPLAGAPCVNCVQRWLSDRRVWFEPASVSDLNIKKELLLELVAANQSHVYYEIHREGTATRLDCMVYPHAECDCNRKNYVAPEAISKKTNFAFSPIQQIKCARYGTPDGNLWLSSASGQNISTFGAAREREASRLTAVDEWFKKAALEEARTRTHSGEKMASHNFQTGEAKEISSLPTYFESIGVGASHEATLIDGLERFSLVRTLKKYAGQAKNPMLVVGANTWLRGRVPFFLLQQYDIHLLFYPNSTPTWVVGILALSRIRLEEPPLFAFASHAGITEALDGAIGKILIQCRPSEWNPMQREPTEKKSAMASRLHLWWNNWVYRCPKISLRDILHLEQYGRDLEQWRNYFRDGQEEISVANLNSPLLPAGIRHVLALYSTTESLDKSRNLNGIGIWSNVSELINV